MAFMTQLERGINRVMLLSIMDMDWLRIVVFSCSL